MSIEDEIPSVHELNMGGSALMLFVDRYDAINRFLSYLNDDPPRKKILFFYGDGGNGKSLLVYFLSQYCCKRFQSADWEHLKNLSKEDFLSQIKAVECTKPVPDAYLDFAARSHEENDDPQDSFSALMMLRRHLGQAHKLDFPLFDFASLQYLQAKNQLTPERLRKLFPLEQLDLIMDLAGIIGGAIPFGGTVASILNLLNRRQRDSLTLYLQQRRIDKSRLQEIQRMGANQMSAERELLGELPRLFAEDLNNAMAAEKGPDRIVFFFDTHEAFWGLKQDMSNAFFFQRDEWLRCLLRNLDLEAGIVVVVAGRDQPKWAEAPNNAIKVDFFDLQPIGFLTEMDATLYLRKRNIIDSELCRSLITCALVKPDQVHPLYLGLCADTVTAAVRNGIKLKPEDFNLSVLSTNREKELIYRLLQYVDGHVRYAVYALSACRAFNRDIYVMLGQMLNFRADEPEFLILTQFSFVWQLDFQGKGWYRIHDLLRRLFPLQKGEVADIVSHANQALQEHYSQIMGLNPLDGGAIAEAIYHANRLDWERGVKLWLAQFYSAMTQSHFDVCRILLEVQTDLVIGNDFRRGQVFLFEGTYLLNMAELDEASGSFEIAITAFDKALSLVCQDTIIQNAKGIALEGLGLTQKISSHYDDSLDTYCKAIKAFDEVLTRLPQEITALTSKGSALFRLAEVQRRLSLYVSSGLNYKRAIETFDVVLNQSNTDLTTLNKKGVTLIEIGELQTRTAQFDQGTDSYNRALEAFAQILQLAPDNVQALDNKGSSLFRLAELQERLAKYDQAKETYEDALAEFDKALQRMPQKSEVFINKGATLLRLGELQMRASQQEKAEGSYWKAIEYFDEAIKEVPKDVLALTNKGSTLLRIAELEVEVLRLDKAITDFSKAIEAMDEALVQSPGETSVLTNKGVAMLGRGELKAKLLQPEAAADDFRQAMSSIDGALVQSPGDIVGLRAKGLSLLGLARLKASYQTDEAIVYYDAAIATFDRVLGQAQEDPLTLVDKGVSCSELGDLHVKLSRNDQAFKSFENATAAFDKALARAPKSRYVQEKRRLTLLELADLQVNLWYEESGFVSPIYQVMANFDT